MASSATRVEVHFAPEQLTQLRSIAQVRGESLDSLIQKAVEEVYLQHERQERLEAVRRITAFRLPVADWEQMDRESMDEHHGE